jgi:hypothetical protein
MSARFAHSVGALSDPSECLFDRSCKTPVSSVQTDLQLRFRIGIGLVNEIAVQASCGWHPGLIVALGRGQLTLFLQQQSVVSR